MIRGREQIDRAWSAVIATKLPASVILRMLCTDVRRNFVDIGPEIGRHVDTLLSLGVFAAVSYACWFLVRRSPPRVWLYVMLTLLVTAIPVVMPDLFSSDIRTAKTRYLFVVLIDTDLAVIYLLWRQMCVPAAQVGVKPLWPTIFALLLGVEAGSCAMSAQAQTWWSKNNEQAISIAATINRSAHPLVISDSEIAFALTLSNYLDPRVRVELWPRCYLCAKTPRTLARDVLRRTSASDDVFLLGPSTQLDAQARVEASRTPQHLTCIDLSACPAHLSLLQE